MSISHCGGYTINRVSLVVLQEYEVDRSSCGVQENLRNCLEPLMEMQVGVMLIIIYLSRNGWFSFRRGSHSYPKIVVESPFQACNDDC